MIHLARGTSQKVEGMMFINHQGNPDGGTRPQAQEQERTETMEIELYKTFHSKEINQGKQQLQDDKNLQPLDGGGVEARISNS